MILSRSQKGSPKDERNPPEEPDPEPELPPNAFAIFCITPPAWLPLPPPPKRSPSPPNIELEPEPEPPPNMLEILFMNPDAPAFYSWPRIFLARGCRGAGRTDAKSPDMS